jgi:hypothetical protein
MGYTVDNLKNPYLDFFHWCKGELYDIRAMKEMILRKEEIEM